MCKTLKVKYISKDIDKLDFIGGTKSDWIDLRCSEHIVLKKGEYKAIPLGVAIELPEGYEALVAPRSSTYKHYGIIATNSIGIIDESYKGDNDQWHFMAYALRDTEININDRICQFRIIKHQPSISIETVEYLGNDNRGGHGSTGKK